MNVRYGAPGLAALILVACVAPNSQLGQVSPEDIKAEQLRQQQLVIKGDFRDQLRLENVGYALLKHGVAICGPGHTGTRAGFAVANVHTFSKEYQPAARALGFTDTLAVVSIVTGSAAARAGLRVGDRIATMGDAATPTGKSAMKGFSSQIGRLRNQDRGFSIAVRHGPLDLAMMPALQMPGSVTRTTGEGTGATLRIPSDTVCSFSFSVIKDSELNAFADGDEVYVTSGMLRFAMNDDELAVVVSHEIAHNAMDHMKAKKKNATLGAVFGAMLDIAAATQGVNTDGGFTKDFSAIGGHVFSQDFEREADYVGMYVLARSGRSYATAAEFWRRMGQESPGSIKFASSHPTTAERFLRLDQTAAEMDRKKAADLPLLPDARKR